MWQKIIIKELLTFVQRKGATAVIMPLPQESKKRKSINRAENCNEDSCCVAASSQCSYAFIPLCLHFLPFSLFLSITLFLSHR